MKTQLLICLFILFSVSEFSFANGLKVVQLFPVDDEFLREQNQISRKCIDPVSEVIGSIKKYNDCYRLNMKPVIRTIETYSEPSEKSKIVGRIHVKIENEGIATVTYSEGKNSGTYSPDSDGTDSGYDGYFLYSVAAESGDWIQLPRMPFEKPVWINLVKVWGSKWAPRVKTLGMRVYESHKGSIVLLEVKEKKLIYRLENASDMNCEGLPVDRATFDLKKREMPVKEVYDSDGHILLRDKYPRGC